MERDFGRAIMKVAGTAKSVSEARSRKRVASSTERESKQRSRRPILKCVSFWERCQRWLSALISNDLNRNRQAGPISPAVRADNISNRV